MARSDDFELIREIVAAGGRKHTIGELDRIEYRRLVALGWLKAFFPRLGDVSYWVTERGKAAASRS